MTGPEDRMRMLALVDEAVAAGARPHPCCSLLGLHPRTLARWRCGGGRADRRPTAVRPKPANALSAQERAVVLEVANRPANADKPPAQIVPELADQGIYLASESTVYRILHQHQQLAHRGRARAPKPRSKPAQTATGPNQIWVWDITYLKSHIAGIYFYLYLIMDLHSRKIIGHEVFDAENAKHSTQLLRRTALAENIAANNHPLVLHGDNGSPLKAGTVLATMHQLGITPSHSRPRVSNDNAFAEAAFRTLKYHPSLDPKGFGDIDAARRWAAGFTHWYNNEHKHASIRFVTPSQKHAGEDLEILAKRKQLYEQAKAANPARWFKKNTRDWSPVKATSLAPADDRIIERIHKNAA